jgi:hypothetical protein
MASGGMIYIRSFIMFGLGGQKLLGGDTHTDSQTARSSLKPTFIFLPKESRVKYSVKYVDPMDTKIPRK